MLSAANSSLVAGGTARNDMEKNMKVKVERPFYYLGAVQAKGSVVELPRAIAMEVVGMGRATTYVAPQPKAKEAEAKSLETKESK